MNKVCCPASFLLGIEYIVIQLLSHIYKWPPWPLDLLIRIFSFHTEPPPVIQVPHNITVTPGERAVLTCLVISAVDFNLTWQRNGRDVRGSDPARMRILANMSLELRSVKLSDAGEYHCVVSSEGGSSAASVLLTVQGTLLMVTSVLGHLSVVLPPSLFSEFSLWGHLSKNYSLKDRRVVWSWLKWWQLNHPKQIGWL